MTTDSIADHCEALIDEMAASMSRPQLALEALVLYRASELPVPEWALEEIAAAYDNFKHGAPTAAWKREAWFTPAPRSLGEAFSVDDVKGEHSDTRRRRAMLTPVLVSLFHVQKVYPKSEAGFRAAAEALNVTEKQVKTWLQSVKPSGAEKS